MAAFIEVDVDLQISQKNSMFRIGTLPVDLVVDCMREGIDIKVNGLEKPIVLKGSRINTYKLSQQCAYTGIPIDYFAIEMGGQLGSMLRAKQCSAEEMQWHVNPYSQIQNLEMMMTSDHIIPRSLGGANCLLNRQPLLADINVAKQNSIFVQDIEEADKRGLWDLMPWINRDDFVTQDRFDTASILFQMRPNPFGVSKVTTSLRKQSRKFHPLPRGTMVQKVSGQPFSNGQFHAVIRDYCVNPAIDRPAYLFEDMGEVCVNQDLIISLAQASETSGNMAICERLKVIMS